MDSKRDQPKRTKRPRARSQTAKAASVLLGAALLTSFVAMACRGEPTGDPKTPANSPIPEVDRKDPDTAKSPSLKVDAGK